MRVLDCDDIEQWLEQAPAVSIWLAKQMGKIPPEGIVDLASYWSACARSCEPIITPDVLLAGRTEITKKLEQKLAAGASETRMHALSLTEVLHFLSALSNTDGGNISELLRARAVIVENREAWRSLASTKFGLILIPGEGFDPDRSMVSEAVASGHQVFTCTEYTSSRNPVTMRLPRIERMGLENALVKTGFVEPRAHRLARESSGSSVILLRLASKFDGQWKPGWASPSEPSTLLPLALLGGWSDDNTEDRLQVESLAKCSYSSIHDFVTGLMGENDSPVRLIDGECVFVSREDSWRILSPNFSKNLLNDFREIALKVLDEDDPRFQMPADERYLAGFRKQLPKYSPSLKKGIAETVCLLGVLGENTPRGFSSGSGWVAGRIVCELLENASPVRWFSLASYLPLLAEATPDEFLTAIEFDLNKETPSVGSLFENNSSGLFSSTPHVGLVWAMQVLAWYPEHLSRVAMALAELSKLDGGGNSDPRPASVLYGLFRLWYPQTSASAEERFIVLEQLSQSYPEQVWNILLGLVSTGSDSATGGNKPNWRNTEICFSERPSNQELARQRSDAGRMLAGLAGNNHEKWLELLKRFDRLPEIIRKEVLRWVGSIKRKTFHGENRILVWTTFRDFVWRHRFFSSSGWAVSGKSLKTVSDATKRLRPDNLFEVHRHLFQHGSHYAFGTRETPREEQDGMEKEARANAIQEIWNSSALTGILEFATLVKLPFLVGRLLGDLELKIETSDLVPTGLVSQSASIKDLSKGFLDSMLTDEAGNYPARFPLEDWPSDAVTELAFLLPCDSTTWEMIRNRKPEAEDAYWKRIHPYGGRLIATDLSEVCRNLLIRGRPFAAIDCLTSAIFSKIEPGTELVLDVLEHASKGSDELDVESAANDHLVWEAEELVEYLQKRSEVDSSRLAGIEWSFLPLSRRGNFSPKTLHKELSSNPQFFAEVLGTVYKAKNEKPKRKETIDSARSKIAGLADNLLDSWNEIPGADAVGNVDESELIEWIAEARRLCSENDRLEVCDLTIGRILSGLPIDSYDNWPSTAIRKAMETVKTDEIIRGFDLGVIKQHGVTTKEYHEGGEQERALAERFGSIAERLKFESPRTAQAMRGIAKHYASSARKADEETERRF